MQILLLHPIALSELSFDSEGKWKIELKLLDDSFYYWELDAFKSISTFIKNNYHQPARARNYIIDTKGKVISPEIIFPSVHPDIASEIYRIMRLFQYDVVIKKLFKITLELPYDESSGFCCLLVHLCPFL